MSDVLYTLRTFAKDAEISFLNLNDAVKEYEREIKWFYFEVRNEIGEMTDLFNQITDIKKYQDKIHQNENEDYFLNKAGRGLVDNNPKTRVASSKAKMSDIPPVALFALGAAMSDGAVKYGRYNWRDTASTASVFYDAINRHLADWYNGEDYADDSKINHLAHIMASCAILLDAQLHGNLNDDRDKRKSDSISRNPTWKKKD